MNPLIMNPLIIDITPKTPTPAPEPAPEPAVAA